MKAINYNDSYLDGLDTGWRIGSEVAKKGLDYLNVKPGKKPSPFYQGYYEGYDGGYTAVKEHWYD